MKPPSRGRSDSRPPSAKPGGKPDTVKPGGRSSYGKSAFGKSAFGKSAFGKPSFSKPGSKPSGRQGERPAPPAPRPEPPPKPTRPEAPRLTLSRPQPTRAPREPEREARERDNKTGGRETPRGTVWLYGLHAVAAALLNPQRRLRRLVLTEEAQQQLTSRLGGSWPIAPETVERSRIDTLLGRDAVHQGAALLADPLAPPSLAAVLERSGPLLVLDQVSDPRNVGAILRSAAAFGAAAVIAQDRNAPDETGALAKAASGALETVPLLRAVNLARTLVALKAAGCWTVGLAADAARLSGAALAQRRVALVLGSEGEGLRRLTRDTCDELAGIAMPGAAGGLDSLNVSATAAVALYELARRG